MENKYKEGDIVYALINPSIKLVVRRYISRIYYCSIFENEALPALAYFERELLPVDNENKLFTIVH